MLYKTTKYLAALVAIVLCFSASAALQPEPTDSICTKDSLVFEECAISDSILDYADNFLGTRYRGGGKCPKGFDCSGFVMFVFKKFGYQTPASSSAIKSVGEEVKITEARPGDIIYFTGRNARTKRPGHVGIVWQVQNGVIYFIHASVNKGISFSHNETAYYKKRYLGIRRVIAE